MQLATDCVGSSEKRASVLEQRQSCLSITHKTEAEHGSRARKPSTEAGAAHIICHPELAKDLTAGQSALGHHSPFSELTAPPDEPSVPITRRLKRTSRSPREIPSTDSGQALRRLPMNLPLAGGRHPAFAVGRSLTRERRGVRQSCAAFASRTDFRPTGRRLRKGSLRSECLIPSESVSR